MPEGRSVVRGHPPHRHRPAPDVARGQRATGGHDGGERRRHRARHRGRARGRGTHRAQLERVRRPVGQPRHREPDLVRAAPRAVGNRRPGRRIAPGRLVPVLVARDARTRRRRVPGQRNLTVAGRGPQVGRGRGSRRVDQPDRHLLALGQGREVAGPSIVFFDDVAVLIGWYSPIGILQGIGLRPVGPLEMQRDVRTLRQDVRSIETTVCRSHGATHTNSKT